MGDDRRLPAPVVVLPAYTVGDALGVFGRLLHSLGYQATLGRLLEEAAAHGHRLNPDAATCSEVRCLLACAFACGVRRRKLQLHAPVMQLHRACIKSCSTTTKAI